jgi:heme-degrading monooxygenase HmoA
MPQEVEMLLARVRIGDFDHFWSVFTTKGADHRRAFGSAGARVLRNQDDPQEVIILFDWSKEEYERFLADPDTTAIMASAGLQGPPETIAVEAVGETGS